MTPLLVSIIIPCYNAENYVAEAIQSALDQTYQNCEVIVIDDGSTDGSLEAIKSFGNKIHWQTGPNRGGCAARNRGFEISAGEFVQFLDADDLLHKQRIEILILALALHVGADFAWAPHITFQERQVPGTLFSRLNPVNVSMIESEDVLRATYAPSASLFLRPFLEKVGAWNESLQRWVDLEYHGRIALRCKKFVMINISLYGYRQHGGGRISDANKTNENIEEALRSLNLTRDSLNVSTLARDEISACICPFFTHLARSAAASGRKSVFQSCLKESIALSKSKQFRMKATLAIIISNAVGIRATSFILERLLPRL